MTVENYLPSKLIRINGYCMVYVPNVNISTTTELNLLVARILATMPKFYNKVLKSKKLHWIDKEVFIIGESNSYTLYIADNNDKTAIVLAVRPNAPSHAKDKIHSAAMYLFNNLNAYYSLTVRIGPNIVHTYNPYLNDVA